jgi:hypothetical protein
MINAFSAHLVRNINYVVLMAHEKLLKYDDQIW